MATLEETTSAPSPVLTKINPRRLHIIIAGLWLSLFLSALDGTIITTGLLKISSDFNATTQSAWIVTAYLLTYNSFLMITAKLSDIWGVKTVLLACSTVFFTFSMACGGSKSIVQLIIFRAFQGIGGSGMYSLVFVAIMKLVNPEEMGFYSGVVSSVFALANLLGPILGGVITDRTTWRWMFYMNGPIIALGSSLIFFAMPGLADNKSSKDRLLNFDILGGILSVGWPIPLLFALQEGGSSYPWSSSVIIGTLVTGIACFFLFGLYETWISSKPQKEAIFPIKFITNPVMSLLLLSMLLLGMPFYSSVVLLPQRFQTTNLLSAERAGVLLLPVTLLTPVGAMIGGLLTSKKVPAEYVLILGTSIVCIGIGLVSSLPVSTSFHNTTYGYEIITGFGLGLASPAYFVMLYTSVEEKDASVATGALNMARTLGGCIAISLTTALHHSYLTSHLPAFLTPSQIAAVEQNSTNIVTLPPNTQTNITGVFGESYNRQFQVMLGLACLNFVIAAVLALVRKKKGIFGKIPVRTMENEFTRKDKEEDTLGGEEGRGGGELEEKSGEGKVAVEGVAAVDAAVDVRDKTP